MFELYSPFTPLQTVSTPVCPRMLIFMIGKKLAGT